ncbi:DUF4153 domain-containing protein [Flammeovirga sp. EKP202]|uniref:DUF4153 domain-containing protein n=1 Tax=Flammeovirga sp. EKP202 TaxID=2770592 RepID=UPI00165FAB28|nr:DUF4153 domain-containing protein [Flammeovirga sp. EKP202]MBD0401631.1 DUF4153 domain-containing protein [Flammeovirga sp. EKP202]
MKLPSIQYLFNSFLKSIKTFPFTILSAILLTFLLFFTIDSDNTKNIWMVRGLHGAQIGIPTFIAITFLSQKLKLSILKTYSIRIVGLLLLSVYVMSLPDELTYIHFSRGALLTVFSFLLPFLGISVKESNNLSYWFNAKNIISTFIECLFYSVIINIGISIALLAIEALFDVSIKQNTYLKLGTFNFVFLNTVFFTSKIDSFSSESDPIEYPPLLKNLVQFILLPLVCTYLIILYTYGFKIILAQNWPKGWVSYLSIGFSFLGISSLLIIYPIRNDKGLKWISLFSKGFYYALFPVILLFCSAIYRRISEYGITEFRYYLIVLGLWLFFIALYFLIRGQNNIKVIPIALALLTFTSAFGPLSAFNVSRKSQYDRLYSLGLKNNWINTEGQWVKSDFKVSEDYQNIRSIVVYLIDHHGYNTLQPLLKEVNLDEIVKEEDSRWKKKEVILAEMKLKEYYKHTETDQIESYTPIKFVEKYDLLYDIEGYQYSTSISLRERNLTSDEEIKTYQFSNSEITVSFQLTNKTKNIGILTINNKQFDIPYTSFEKGYFEHKGFNNENYRIYLKRLSGYETEDLTKTDNISFVLFFNKP